MSGVRPSVAGKDGIEGLGAQAQTQRISIKRASTKYEVANGDVGELQIENDRLQTSVMILTQKLKMKEDDNAEELEKLQKELNQWKDKYKNMRSDHAELES